jgi:hypothetical protein
MTKVKVKIYLEIEVEVEGGYQQGTSGNFYKANGEPADPPEPPEFNIHQVLWQGIDITEMLDSENFDFGSLESDCLETIHNES